MELLKLLNANIKDEEGATDDYTKMLEVIANDELLTDEEKGLMSGIVVKIKTDEETHQLLLTIMRDVMESKNEK